MPKKAPICVALSLVLTAGLPLAQNSAGAVAGGAGSESAQADGVEIPKTPAGRQMTDLLFAVESGNYKDYITHNFKREFLEAFPMERHLEFFREIRIMHGGFTVHAIERSSDYEIVVLARSSKRDVWRRLDMTVESEPPHKVAAFGIEEAMWPAEESEVVALESESEVIAHVQMELKEMAERDQLSGAVLIAKNGEPLFRRAYGQASLEFAVPNRPDTKFNIGSINKSFTSMAIAQLLERGLIDLDERIGEYLSDLPDDWGEKITIRHLLTMRSGLGHYWNEDWERRFAKIRTVDDLMDVIVKTPLQFEPGSSRQYSNSGYVVLGALIERVTGQSYYEYVRENIFEPAGMENTDSYELDQIVPNLARGYTENRSDDPYLGNARQNNFFLHSVKGSPAGGGYSTVDDLNRYVEALKRNALAGQEYTNMVLGMFENAEDPRKRPAGIGVAGGASVGINAIVEADFPSGYTVIVLSNYDPPTAKKLGLKFMRMLRAVE